MRKIIYIFVFLFSFNICFSQDTILFKNGTSVNAKVLEVNSFSVKYKIFESIDGPIYEEDKNRITFIKFLDGRIDTTFVKTSNDSSLVKVEQNVPFVIIRSDFKDYHIKTEYYKYSNRQQIFAVAGIPCIAAGLMMLVGSFTIAMSSHGDFDLAKKGAMVGGVFIITGISFEIVSLINGVKKKKER